ncbi:MAG: hypothetical protein HY927_12410, partial [Elusimicrobia bacterium]|nr:hypothetical protein [Elusimicrobiota bacterium]
MVWKPDSYLRTPRWRQGTAVPEGAGHAPLAGGGWPTLLPWASAMAVLAAVYLPVLGAPFVWDDLGAIFFNSSLERPIPLTAYFGPEYFSLSGETTWRPLATLSYNALAVIAGKSPLAFRASGLALHLAAAALLARLLLGSGLSAGAAATAAALFLVHPAHVETLMCAAFNEELLAACGVLAMLLAHRAGMTLIAAAAFLAALASKETALAALPLVVLDDWSHHGPDRARRNLPRYAAYAAAAAAFEWWSIAGLAAPGFLARAAIPPWHRLYFAVESLWHGFRVQLIPTGLRIEYFALPPSSGLQVLAAAAFAAVFTGSAAAALKRFWKEPSSARPSNSLPEGGRDARPPTWTARPLAFYLAWPLLFWFAFSGLVPAGSLTTRLMAERWLYLPLLGSAALAAALLEGRPRVAL